MRHYIKYKIRLQRLKKWNYNKIAFNAIII